MANLELHDVRFDFAESELRPAIFGENIGTLVLDRFQSERASGGAPPIEGQAIEHLIVDDKEAPATQAQVTALDVPRTALFAGVPFEVTETLQNTGAAGLVDIPLRLGERSVPRSVWLEAREKAQVAFVNLRESSPGDVEVRAGRLTKMLHILARPEGHAPSALISHFRTPARSSASLARIPSISPPTAITQSCSTAINTAGFMSARHCRDATVVVELENPDLVTNWQGRVGIIVRNDISKPGESSGYLILGSSPAASTYLEWDDNANGMLDTHTEFAGYTLWPHWLKLEQHADKFTGYSSTDGANWTAIAQAEVPNANDLLDVGMFAFRSSALFEDFRLMK